MKVISYNINGLRSSINKGNLQSVIDTYSPDIILLQEVKCTHNDVDNNAFEGYIMHINSASKKGYAGTGMLIKQHLEGCYKTDMKLINDDNEDGRYIDIELDNTVFIGVYAPNGGRNEEQFLYKLSYFDTLYNHIKTLSDSGKTVYLLGDLNIAHNEIDLARPKDNKKSIGFLPVERALLDAYHSYDFVDIWRYNNPSTVQYSWWSNLSGARHRNIGWRIDAVYSYKNTLSQVYNVQYLDTIMGSDHCPVMLITTE